MDLFDNNIDVNKYRVFLAVAECCSFSKATEYLHISQPAVSHAIKELEEQLNTKLFIRNNKTVILTEEGERIRTYVKKAFNTISLGEKTLKEKGDDLSGIIRIGIFSHISLFMLPKVMQEFNDKYPSAKFHIYSSSKNEMLEKLRNNELDFVVMLYPIFINDANLKEEIICNLETCFFADKHHYDLYSKSNKSITEFSMILPVKGFSDINNLEETLKKHNIVLKHNFTSYTTELAKELAKEGMGIGWGLKKCVEQEIKKGELYELKTDFKVPIATFSIAYDDGFLNNTTKEFIKLFKERMKEISID